ncbi:MAG: hypothetical protein BMS9Abin03_262 [Thermodesulfobacteriota bacterium]|nr:MAG: hypothetical protein BMS9Abin03_262 [Thermodesulfobacteriota bacterium]
MATLIVHRQVVNYLKKLPKVQKKKIKTLLRRLEKNPLDYPKAINMAGEWTGYSRIRIGNLRVIYWYDKMQNTIYVDHIGPRGDVYKKR